VAGSFAAHVVVRQAVQLVVNQGRQLVERGVVPLTPGSEQTRNIMR
jgi:hypothetical protein